MVLSGKVPYIITSTFFIPKILRNCAILFEKKVLNIRAKRILTVSQCNCHQRNLRDVSVCSGFIIQTNWRLKKKKTKKRIVIEECLCFQNLGTDSGQLHLSIL